MFLAWLKRWADEVKGATALAGVVIGVIGFGTTWLQLSRTTRTLQASNTYAVQKDIRALDEKLLADPRFGQAVADGLIGNLALSESYRDTFIGQLWLYLNLYLSVYRQAQAGGLLPEFVRWYARDYCQFMQKPGVREGWSLMLERDMVGTPQYEMWHRWCGA